MQPKRILIIEDDIAFSLLMKSFLEKNGFKADIAGNIRQGKKLLESPAPDLLLMDYRLPDGTGMDLLQDLRREQSSLPVIIMTSFHDIKTAVKAIKHGASDFITKPVHQEELIMRIRETFQAPAAPPSPSAPLPSAGTVPMIIGDTPQAKQMYEHILLVAPTELSVILQGESGTGKEQAARTIHQLSKRAEKPFLAVDCGVLSPELAGSELFGHLKGAFTGALTDKSGYFSMADGGTIFLDEIGNLSYEVQVKLLRVLQERIVQPIGSNQGLHVDIRIITATNDDLLASVKAGTFREDLYHRLNEFTIRIPPLRERKMDFDLFTGHFLGIANRELQKNVREISAAVKQRFLQYDWPGNLREMKNIIKRAVLLSPGDMIHEKALPEEMISEAFLQRQEELKDLKQIRDIQEKELIEKTLKETMYNKSKTAKLLNIDRKTLYYKMEKYGIKG